MVQNFSQMFDFGSKTDKGRVREKNEDNLGFFSTPNGQLALICDGMGGHSAGALASEIAMNSIREYFESNTYEDISGAIEDAYAYANSQVFDESEENSDMLGMGTTCVLVLIKDNSIYYGNVGDSRVYILRDGQLKQLTTDHTYVQKLIEKGELKKEEAQNHPRKNELLRAIGVNKEVQVDVIAEPLEAQNGDVLMLCSDGLTSMVNEITIEYSLKQSSNSAQEKANHLTELAINEGGYDNVSVQVIDFNQIPEETAEKVIKKNKFVNILHRYIPFFKRYPKAIYGIYALIAFIFIWAVYDMFFKSVKTPLNENNEVVQQEITDTSGMQNDADTSITENASIQHNTQGTSAPTHKAVYLTYTIRKGDALSLIAQRFNLKANKLMEANKLDNARIRVGQQIKIPLKAIYTIKTGDNLYDIAKKYGVSRKLLRKANRMKRDKDIYVGNNLYIPYP